MADEAGITQEAAGRRHCPILGRETETRLTRYGRGQWRLVECVKTGLVYLDNPPDYVAFEEDFAWEKTQAEERRRRNSDEPIFSLLSSAAKNARRLIKRPRKITSLPVDYFRRRGKGDGELALLDLGAGDGRQTVEVVNHLTSELGRTVRPVAIEISKAQAKEAQDRLAVFPGGRCIQASALEGLERLEGIRPDLVLLCSFLEHELHPVELLSKCGDALKPDGIVVIKVPNFDSWNRYTRQGRWCGFRFPDHVNYFTPKTLRMTIEAAGLEVGRMNFRDRFPLSDNMYAVARKRRAGASAF